MCVWVSCPELKIISLSTLCFQEDFNKSLMLQIIFTSIQYIYNFIVKSSVSKSISVFKCKTTRHL